MDKFHSFGIQTMAELFTTTRDTTAKSASGGKFKNRNRMEIVANLLTIAKSGALKTHLMYRANLSYLMVTEYLDFLTRANLVKETVDMEGTAKLYQTTEKGLKYLEVYDSLQSIVGLDAHKVVSKSDIFS
jgi:predicted transcriptional regulator